MGRKGKKKKNLAKRRARRRLRREANYVRTKEDKLGKS